MQKGSSEYIEQEGLFLAACWCMVMRSYQISSASMNMSFKQRAHYFFDMLTLRCKFPDALIFNKNDFDDEVPVLKIGQLEREQSPNLGLYCFLNGCFDNGPQFYFELAFEKKYPYAALFLDLHPSRIPMIEELANQNCGEACFIKWQFLGPPRSQVQKLRQNAMAGFSIGFLYNAKDRCSQQGRVVDMWKFICKLAQLGHFLPGYTILNGSRQLVPREFPAVFHVGKFASIIVNKLNDPSIVKIDAIILQTIYQQQLARVKQAIMTLSACCMRIGIYKDLRVLLAKRVWSMRDQEWV